MTSAAFDRLPPKGRSTMQYYDAIRRALLEWSPTPAFVGPLDGYTAGMEGAWSVARRLLSSYTGSLIRVRRSSDNAEADIGYDADGDLDTAALAAHVGSNSGFVVRIYDQSGNGYPMQNLNAASQPRIVNAGTNVTFGSQARVAMESPSSLAFGLQSPSFASKTGSSWTFNSVAFLPTVSIGNRVGLCAFNGASTDDGVGGPGALYLGVSGPTTFQGGNRAVLAETYPVSKALSFTTTTAGHRLRDSDGDTNFSAFTPGAIAIEIFSVWFSGAVSLASPAGGKFTEGVIWQTDKDSDQGAILGEQATYYGL